MPEIRCCLLCQAHGKAQRYAGQPPKSRLTGHIGFTTNLGQYGLAFLDIAPDGNGGYTVGNVTRYSGNPIVSGANEFSCARVNSTFWIGYIGPTTVSCLSSPDGLTWTYVKKDILVPSGSGWYSSLLTPLHTYIYDGSMYLTLTGNYYQDGVAYCRVGDWTNLTFSPYNPILPIGTAGTWEGGEAGGLTFKVDDNDNVIINSDNTLDCWYVGVQSLGGTGDSGCGYCRIYNINGIAVNVSPSSATLHVGQSQTFTATVTGGTAPYTYHWYLNGTLVSGAMNPWAFNPSSVGSYTVYVEVTDSFGMTATSSTVSVTVYGIVDLAVTGISVDNHGCSIYANDTYADGSTYYYPVEVTVYNAGGLTAGSFHVKLEVYTYNGSFVESLQEMLVLTLAGSASTTVNFTSLFHPTKTGLYRLTATADSQNEVSWNNETNNVLIQDNVPVTVMGDVNGDGRVDILDAVIVSLAWDSTSTTPQWNIRADVNHDGVVEVLDAVRLGLYWGETA